MDRLMAEFLDTSIAELVDFGLPMQMVGALEKKFGIFIKNLERVRDEDISALPNVGQRRVYLLKMAMRRCLRQKMADSDGMV